MNNPHLSEAARLAVVREYPLGERGSDAALSEGCRLATLLCHRPIAAVEMVLGESVVVAAAAGLHVGRLRREDALSPHLLDQESVVVVRDARADPRFAGSKLVHTTGGIRFYAAMPLASPEGAILGGLSVWDRAPGDLAPSQMESLEALGRMVMAQLNLWRRQRQLEKLEAQHARIEAALREAEAKFRSIFEHTVVGIYQTTPDGRYLSANPMLARIYGYDSPEELIEGIGNIESEIYVEDGMREKFVAALQQQDTLTNFEAQIRRKDGTVIWIAENARVVRDDQGQVRFYEGTVQDVTARKLAEEQLRTSEMLYHSLVEELPQNIFRKDDRERFIFANSRFCQTVDRPLHEILGLTDFDLFPPELARKYQADDQRVMREGQTIRETERNVTPDGTTHWVDVIKTPLREASGAVTGTQCIFWDVTERKRLQDALAYERDLLQALLDHSPDIIYFKDPQSRFVKVGRALARRFQVADPEELVGKSSFDLLQPDLARTVHAEEQALLQSGEPIINQVEELVDHQGRHSWASVTKVPIYNRAGAILGLVGVARDITKLIETEQALREAEEKFRAIFENSVEGIYQTSPEGRFIRVNPALARIYGYSSPEELMSNLTDTRTQAYVDPGRRDEFVRRILEKGSIQGFESEIRRRDDSTAWVSESARIVRDHEGRLAFFEGSVEDISARKQVEEEQEKARQAALDSARVKSEFVATVSHEIRTPLNAIVPSAERLLETRLTPQQRYLAESIDYGARMLLQIVNDILELSKIEAGAVMLEDIDFDVHEVIERTVSFFASRAEARHLELVGNIHRDVPQHLRGDPARLGQILNNLVGNAIKFTEAGEVVIEVAAGEMTAEDVELRFQVRDTGIGIPEEAQTRVFQAFAQADGSMSRRYGGTGLGLAITRGFVQSMGGTIDFTSRVGQGTTFHFNVHLHAPSAPVEVVAPGPILAGLRVLVIEDNGSQRAAILDSLRTLRPESLDGADSMASAVNRLTEAARARQPFHLVFFDAELPGTSMLQSARRIRASGDVTARLIALIPPGAVLDVRGLEAAGIAGTLVKPLRQSRLHAELAALIAGESEPQSVPDVPDESESRIAQDLKVLLVEDQPFNQRVAVELLERLGASVDAVSSGSAAVAAFESRPYDLVFMDCQMPGMDGYEATRRIRDVENARSASEPSPCRRVPIVALSANALSDDRDRGIAAGMDDYLTKPLLQSELVRILRQVAARGAPREPAPSPTAAVCGSPAVPTETRASPGVAPPDDVPVLDTQPLEALHTPDDPGALPGFIDQFLDELPARRERLRSAAASDAAALRAEAHSLKGSASYMGARRVVEVCRQLEQAAQSGTLNEVPQLVDALDREIAVVSVALREFAAQPPMAG